MIASRRIETEAPAMGELAERALDGAVRGGWSPRPAEVSPALARMHERLRAARVPSARTSLPVPSIAAASLSGGRDRRDGRAEALAAMDGGTAPIERSSLAEGAPEHVERSLERFVRLRGRSGRTYVFSRIAARHVSLYRNGVFATAPVAGERATIVGDVAPILSNAISDDHLYVHLLSETDGDRAAVIADLS